MINEKNGKFIESTTLSYTTRPEMTEARVDSAETSTAVNDEDVLLRAVMARVADRDQQALAELYDVCSSRLFAVAQCITGDRAAAEEIVSDIFFQLWQSGKRYENEQCRVIVWILTMCRSRALDWLRCSSDALSPSGSGLLQMESAHVEDDSCAWVSWYREGTAIHAAVERLDKTERHIMGLAFFLGLTYQEISERTAIPVNSVKTILRDALSVMRERLLRFGVVKDSP